MYLAVVVFTMLLLPAGCIVAQHFVMGEPYSLLLDTWFVFWSVGIRLVLAGARQFFQPRFTATQIFRMQSDESLPVIRELGIANFAVGLVGVLSLWWPGFRLPMVIVGAIFYGVAGVRHVLHRGKSRNEMIAMVSDLFVAVLLITSQLVRVRMDR